MAWNVRQAAHHAYGKVRHAVRVVDKHLTNAARAAVHVARTTDRAVQFARPLYTHVARPVLRHAGVSTAIADKALSTYDGIRRSLNM
jgi:hypothetical protein